MKQCPVCKTTYTDDTLRYCLADGTSLGDPEESQATVLRKGAAQAEDTVFMRPAGEQGREEIPQPTIAAQQPAGEKVRIEIPQPTISAPRPTFHAQLPEFHPVENSSVRSSGGIYKVLAVVLVLGILGVFVVAAAAFIYFQSGTPERASMDNNKETKGSTQSPTPQKDDTEELREQIANLERRLNDPKQSDQTTGPASIPFKARTTARVNSPNDLYLALRTLPNSQAGARILKIPHGEVISVGECSNPSRLGNRTGRWCQASYGGSSGWVFDAFLIY
jgi:hypothetical protein